MAEGTVDGIFVSLDDFVRTSENVLWNEKIQISCGSEIDDKIEFAGLLNGKILGLGPSQDAIDIPCRP